MNVNRGSWIKIRIQKECDVYKQLDQILLDCVSYAASDVFSNDSFPYQKHSKISVCYKHTEKYINGKKRERFFYKILYEGHVNVLSCCHSYTEPKCMYVIDIGHKTLKGFSLDKRYNDLESYETLTDSIGREFQIFNNNERPLKPDIDWTFLEEFVCSMYNQQI